MKLIKPPVCRLLTRTYRLNKNRSSLHCEIYVNKIPFAYGLDCCDADGDVYLEPPLINIPLPMVQDIVIKGNNEKD